MEGRRRSGEGAVFEVSDSLGLPSGHERGAQVTGVTLYV